MADDSSLDLMTEYAVEAWRQMVYRGSGINEVPAEIRDGVRAALDRDAENIRVREAARRSDAASKLTPPGETP